MLLVPAGALGAIAGGLLVERLKLTLKGILKLQLVAIVILTMTFVPMYLSSCHPAEFAGVNVPYNINRSELYVHLNLYVHLFQKQFFKKNCFYP